MANHSTHGRPVGVQEHGDGPSALVIPSREVWRWYVYVRTRVEGVKVWKWAATSWANEDKDRAIAYRNSHFYHTEFRPDIPQRLVREVVTYEVQKFDEEQHDRLIEAYEKTLENYRLEKEAAGSGGKDVESETSES